MAGVDTETNPVQAAFGRAMVAAEAWCDAEGAHNEGYKVTDLSDLKGRLVDAIEAYGKARSERDNRELRATLECARHQLESVIQSVTDLHALAFPKVVTERPLVSLADHDHKARTALPSQEAKHGNGIACPRCGREMRDSAPGFTLACMPPRKNVDCPACGHNDTRLA